MENKEYGVFKQEETEFLKDLKKVLKKHNVEIVIMEEGQFFKVNEKGVGSFIYKNK